MGSGDGFDPEGDMDPDFEEFFYGNDEEGAQLSDAELDAMLAQSLGQVSRNDDDHDALEAGTKVHATVVRITDGDILVEFGQKMLGAVDASDFETPPQPGDRISAHYQRFDPERGVALLTAKEAQAELFWEDVRPGAIYEGVVTAVNKGGLTLSIGRARAFLPISQIERFRVDALDGYLGQRLRCEVTSVNRGEEDIVVSRRAILEREYEAERRDAVARLQVGDRHRGKVVRINDHGAFIDVGGVEGLLHRTRLRKLGDATPAEGETIEVEVVHIDVDQGRVALEARVGGESAAPPIEGYAPGESITAIVREVTPSGAKIWVDDAVEGWIPAPAGAELSAGAVVTTEVVQVEGGRLVLRLG